MNSSLSMLLIKGHVVHLLGKNDMPPLQSGIQLIYSWCALICGNKEFEVLTKAKQNNTTAITKPIPSPLSNHINALIPHIYFWFAEKLTAGLLQSNCTVRILHSSPRSWLSVADRLEKGDLRADRGRWWTDTGLVPSLRSRQSRIPSWALALSSLLCSICDRPEKGGREDTGTGQENDDSCLSISFHQ